MNRTRDWIKFAIVGAIGVALAVGFVSVVGPPSQSLAQDVVPVGASTTLTIDRPAPVQAAQPLVDLGNAFTAVAEQVQPAVVFIRAEASAQSTRRQGGQLPFPFDRFFQDEPGQQQPRSGQGSGFIISDDGYIITNNHVVEGADRLDVSLFDQRTFKARVVGRDPNTDIAVIKVDGEDLPTVALGNSDSVRVGEWVLAIGSPLGEAFSFTVTAGIVSGRGRGLRGLLNSRWNIQDFIQTDAAINPGNSGGPLVNIYGQVIGVNAAIASQTGFYSGYGFAIPMNLVRSVTDQLIATGKVTRAALGVQISDADELDAEAVGLDQIRGVVIESFAGEDSPARRAGLRPGDVIVELDGKQVQYVAQLQQLVGFKKPGEVAEITVLRDDGKRYNYRVRLIEADTEDEPRIARAEPEERDEPASFESRLGLRVQPFDEQAAAHSRLDPREVTFGLAVTDVDPDGPARGRLTATDVARGVLEVITHVNGRRVRARADLADALQDVRSGQIVTLQVWRMVGSTSGTQIVRVRAR